MDVSSNDHERGNDQQKRGWKAHDPVYVAAWVARDALHELLVRVRYQACGNPGGKGGG